MRQAPPSSRSTRLIAAAPSNRPAPASIAQAARATSARDKPNLSIRPGSWLGRTEIRPRRSWRWTQRASRIQKSHSPSYTRVSRPSATARNYTLAKMAGLDLPDALQRRRRPARAQPEGRARRQGRHPPRRRRGHLRASSTALACGAARRCCGPRRPPRGARPHRRLRQPGWVAAFLGAGLIGAVPVPVNPLLQRTEDYDHYIDDSLAARRRRRRQHRGEAERPRPSARPSRPRMLRADQHRSRVRRSRPRRRAATTWPSGSTAPARPASRRPSCTCSTTSRTRASRTREQVLGINESDTTFSTTGLFHAYGFGNNLTLSVLGRRLDRAARRSQHSGDGARDDREAPADALLLRPDAVQRDPQLRRARSSATSRRSATAWPPPRRCRPRSGSAGRTPSA